MKVKLLSCLLLFATPWTAAYPAPPSMGFSRQEYWNGVPSPSPTESKPLFDFAMFVAITCNGKLRAKRREVYNQVRVFEILIQGSFLREQIRVYIY